MKYYLFYNGKTPCYIYRINDQEKKASYREIKVHCWEEDSSAEYEFVITHMVEFTSKEISQEEANRICRKRWNRQ